MPALQAGKAARGSRSGRPIMMLMDLLGRRWTLRVLWELRAGPLTFRQLQEHCDDVSPSVLNTRLRELRNTGLVRRIEGEGYAATPQARELGELLMPLDSWSKKWARRLSSAKS